MTRTSSSLTARPAAASSRRWTRSPIRPIRTHRPSIRRGREILRDLIAGELPRPPIHHLTGLGLTEAAEGETVGVLPCSKWLSTSAGTVQGGFTAMLAEFTMTAAAFSTAPADTAVATLDFKVNYLRPVFPDGNELTARARIVHRGRTLA